MEEKEVVVVVKERAVVVEERVLAVMEVVVVVRILQRLKFHHLAI